MVVTDTLELAGYGPVIPVIVLGAASARALATRLTEGEGLQRITRYRLSGSVRQSF